jgi:hypothetical protein
VNVPVVGGHAGITILPFFLSSNMLASNLPCLDEECIVSVAENACWHCLDLDIISFTYRHQGCVRVIVLIKLSNSRTSFFATNF